MNAHENDWPEFPPLNAYAVERLIPFSPVGLHVDAAQNLASVA